MYRIKALGINWNKLDPFPRYGPFDFPAVAPAAAPTYLFPVQEVPPAVMPAASQAEKVPDWVVLGGAALAGVALTMLLLRNT